MTKAFKCDWCGKFQPGQGVPARFRFELKGQTSLVVEGKILRAGEHYADLYPNADLCPICKTNILEVLIDQGIATATE